MVGARGWGRGAEGDGEYAFHRDRAAVVKSPGDRWRGQQHDSVDMLYAA